MYSAFSRDDIEKSLFSGAKKAVAGAFGRKKKPVTLSAPSVSQKPTQYVSPEARRAASSASYNKQYGGGVTNAQASKYRDGQIANNRRTIQGNRSQDASNKEYLGMLNSRPRPRIAPDRYPTGRAFY